MIILVDSSGPVSKVFSYFMTILCCLFVIVLVLASFHYSFNLDATESDTSVNQKVVKAPVVKHPTTETKVIQPANNRY